MKIRHLVLAIFILMILTSGTGCQETLVLPDSLPSSSPTPQPDIIRPTRAAHEIATPIPNANGLVFTPVPSTVEAPLLSQIFTPAATATLPPDSIIVGYSIKKRVIIARQLGNGSRSLLLVGGIHGGWEENTVTLINELITYFEENLADILPGLSLVLIPVANPDGLILGREEAGRFNANGVDLNRNWGCEWSDDAYWRDQTVNPGEHPFSEPETRAIAAFVQNLHPTVALFYHSAAGGVFAGGCEGDHGSMLMSQILGQAAGYTYGQVFSAYPVTGTAASWVDGQGIPSADVELQSWTDSEFERNLRGIMAIQCWLAHDAERCKS
jgi:predicted deacylase